MSCLRNRKHLQIDYRNEPLPVTEEMICVREQNLLKIRSTVEMNDS